MTIRKKTGQKCFLEGDYEFDGYVEDVDDPPPTEEERIIPMDFGDVFPPVKSTERAAWWKLLRRR